MIVVKNTGKRVLQVHHSEHGWFHYVRPGATHIFEDEERGTLHIEPSYYRAMDPRFDPRGGDPYNRVGSKAV